MYYKCYLVGRKSIFTVISMTNAFSAPYIPHLLHSTEKILRTIARSVFVSSVIEEF